MTDDIKPELIEKAAKAAYCADIAHEYREHMWVHADLDTTEAYYREARAAIESVADDLRAEGAAQALRDAADEWAEGAWADQFMLAGVYDDVTAVQATAAWFRARADQRPRA